MSRLVFFAVILAIACAHEGHDGHHHSHDDATTHSEHVLILGPDTFDNTINDNELTLVEFFCTMVWTLQVFGP
jgi:hypothetical protein